jgi:hypothetical protein
MTAKHNAIRIDLDHSLPVDHGIWLRQAAADGAALPGTYRPNEATRAAFEHWRNGRRRV